MPSNVGKLTTSRRHDFRSENGYGFYRPGVLTIYTNKAGGNRVQKNKKL